MSTCPCAPCGRVFTGVRGFDMHQRLGQGGITCLDPAGMKRRDGTPLYVLVRDRWAVNARDKGPASQWAGIPAPAT